MSFFGVELNAQLNKLLVQIRLTLAKNSYLPNIRTIYRSCAHYDPQHKGLITLLQFEKVNPIKSRHSTKMAFFSRSLSGKSSRKLSQGKAKLPSIGFISSHSFGSHSHSPVPKLSMQFGRLWIPTKLDAFTTPF
jgi:hypothetical protein